MSNERDVATDLGWLDESDRSVYLAFSRLARRLFVRLDRELQIDVAMPRTSFEILLLLEAGPEEGLRMNEVAEATGSQPSRITQAVRRLEELGQVVRVRARDRRGWFAVLTEEGREALRHAAPHHARLIREHLLDPLDDQEKEQLRRIGEKVLGRLESQPSPSSPSPESASEGR